MRVSLNLHYHSIIVEGKRKLPNQPIIIASNHPNSFLDAIILATVFKRPIHFLARSDVFNTAWSNFILRKLNLIPIYRLQEGHNNLSKNEDTFKHCHEILEKKGCILIFAEGISLVDRKIRPLKKGAVRIGFGAEIKQDFKLGVGVLPVSINYEQATKYRNRIIIAVGEPINLKSYETEYHENLNAAYQHLNNDLFKAIKALTIESEEEEVFETVCQFIGNKKYTLNTLQKIAEKIHLLKKTTIPEWEELRIACSYIQNKHLQIGIDYHYQREKSKELHPIYYFILAIFFPLYLIGFLFLRPPLFLAKYLSQRFVKLDEFFASVHLVLRTILFLLWIIIIALILGNFNPWLYFLSPPLLFLITFVLVKLDYLKIQLKNRMRFYSLQKSKDFARYRREVGKLKTLTKTTLD